LLIGAVNFYADCRCVDIVGLGTFEPVRRPRGEPARAMIDRVTRAYGVKVAIVSIWFPRRAADSIPPHWRWIGKWVFDGDEIWFYAVDAAWEASLREDFERFTPNLPPRVRATTLRTLDVGERSSINQPWGSFTRTE
jgi:hypothetical protein